MSSMRGIATKAGLGSLALLGWAGAALGGTSCPDNMIGVSRTDVVFVMSTPTASVTWTEGPGDQVVPWSAAQSCPEGCYDLPNGTVVAKSFNYLYGPGNTYVRASDDYVLVGPAGPALSFEVVLQLTATIEEEGTASVGLDVLGQSLGLERTSTGTAETAGKIVLAPGTQFRIDATAGAVGGHYTGIATAIGQIRFRGLPTGYAIASCQGYDLPTPAQTTTWGGVKALYR